MQDWNIINFLEEKCENLFIVGDPDQAIYEWRGAKPSIFVNFKADTDIILDENFRSTPNILNVANSVIKNNHNRIEKSLKTNIPSDTIVVYKHAKSEIEESEWIASLVDEMIKKGKKLDDFAILYRASNQSRFVEQALMNKQLSYEIWGGIRFFERKEIKDCIAYLRLIENKDDISFKRIINVPSRKFGKAKLELLTLISSSENDSLYNTLRKHIDEKPFKSEATTELIELIETLNSSKDTMAISELLESVLKETGLKDIYSIDGDEERLENINELINSIRFYEEINQNEDITLDKYLQEIALFTNSDYKKNSKTIKMMTVHQSKGLEFPCVFIIGLTEGSFPNHRNIREHKREGLEEDVISKS